MTDATINRFTSEFLRLHPTGAARVLETLPAEEVARFLGDCAEDIAASVMEQMVSPAAVACLRHMDNDHARAVLIELPVALTARLLRALPGLVCDELMNELPERYRRRVSHLMAWPVDSAGALMQGDMFLLPLDISVADALERLRHAHLAVNGEVFVVDDEQHLAGMVIIGELLRATPTSALRSQLHRNIPTVAVRSALHDLIELRSWHDYRTLPVIEHDRTLVGLLHHTAVQQAAEELPEAIQRTDILENLLSIAALYWLIVAELFSSLGSVRRQDKSQGR